MQTLGWVIYKFRRWTLEVIQQKNHIFGPCSDFQTPFKNSRPNSIQQIENVTELFFHTSSYRFCKLKPFKNDFVSFLQ